MQRPRDNQSTDRHSDLAPPDGAPVAEPAARGLELGPQERRMLKELAEFASAPERIYRATAEGFLPSPHASEHAFYLGRYRGTFSLARLDDGSVHRALSVATDGDAPAPEALTKIARELGFTGARHRDDRVIPGKDWKLGVAADSNGDAPAILVFQRTVDPMRN